jgi:hypothetical protein
VPRRAPRFGKAGGMSPGQCGTFQNFGFAS